MFGPSPPGQVRIWSVHHQYSGEGLALPGEDRDALEGLRGALRADDDGGGRLVLGRVDVAGGPADLRTESGERLDEDRRLHGHVE